MRNMRRIIITPTLWGRILRVLGVAIFVRVRCRCGGCEWRVRQSGRLGIDAEHDVFDFPFDRSTRLHDAHLPGKFEVIANRGCKVVEAPIAA